MTMPRKPDDSVSSCEERMQRAAWALAVGELSLPARLQGAAEIIVVLDPHDFPRDLRVKFANIHEAITAEGSFADSVRRMTPERAGQVARDIWELAAEVARRDAIETTE
jgi:hypothetical protein